MKRIVYVKEIIKNVFNMLFISRMNLWHTFQFNDLRLVGERLRKYTYYCVGIWSRCIFVDITAEGINHLRIHKHTFYFYFINNI